MQNSSDFRIDLNLNDELCIPPKYENIPPLEIPVKWILSSSRQKFSLTNSIIVFVKAISS